MIQAVIPDIIGSDLIDDDFLLETLVEGVQWANRTVHESSQKNGARQCSRRYCLAGNCTGRRKEDLTRRKDWLQTRRTAASSNRAASDRHLATSMRRY